MQWNKLLLGICILIYCSSCDYGEEINYHSEYAPVLMTRDQLEKSVSYQQPRAFLNVGKIYQAGTYLLINEKYKGVHVIDNQNPATPKNIGFISAPGCIDMAVKGTSLYLDNAVDLVTIDFADLSDIKVTERIKDTFKELLPPDSEGVPKTYRSDERPANTIIVAWEKKAK